MVRNLIFITLIAFSFCIKASDVLEKTNKKSEISLVKIYFEDRNEARSFQDIMGEDEDLINLSTAIMPTGNGGFYISIESINKNQLRVMQKLFQAKTEIPIMTFCSKGKFLGWPAPVSK
ncbi:MAG: hypothetical protein P4L22_06025 [Candidatus Babeliales bacterium]|nr:hypothetical protein [Candidatus Babeliales bacterium]